MQIENINPFNNLFAEMFCKNTKPSIKDGSKYIFIPPQEKNVGIANNRIIKK